MPPVRLAHGVLAAATEEAWLAWPNGQPVAGAPRGSAAPPPGAPVALGPRTSRPGAVVAALVRLDELLRSAGPAACGAGVDLGGGFRSARLDGAVEERRDAVLAALRWLSPNDTHRLGDRSSVLTALCGPRATRRVGAALHNAALDERWAAIHLAVAASDVLEPEQLEHVLTLPEPPGVEPIPGGLPSTLAGQLGEVLATYPRARRLTLLLDLWKQVLVCPDRPRPPIRLMEGQLGEERVGGVLLARRGIRDAWVLEHLGARGGPLHWGVRSPWPERAETAMWTGALFDEDNELTADGRAFADEESQRLLADTLAALTLTAVAVAASRRSLTQVLAEHSRALVMSIRPDAVPADQPDLDAMLAGPLPAPGRPGHLVARLAVAAIGADAWDFRRDFNMYWWAIGHRGTRYGPPSTGLFSDCAGIFRLDDNEHRDVARFAQPLLSQAYPQGRAVLTELLERFPDEHPLPHGQVALRWARACGWDPEATWAGRRRPPYAACDCNGWWILALTDNLAALEQRPRIAPGWTGGEVPWPALTGETEEADPDEPPAAPDSVPGAVAAAAQFLRWGAGAPTKPGTWTEFTAALRSQILQVAAPFQVPAEIAAWHGQELPDTDLRIQVAHNYTDLNEWAAYMGNCIAGYAEAGESGQCVLLALREPDGTIVANIDLHHGRSGWSALESQARFNAALEPTIEAPLQAWLATLPATRTAPGAEPDAESEPGRVVREPGPGRSTSARRSRPNAAVLTARQELSEAAGRERTAYLAEHGAVLVEVAARIAPHPPTDADAAVVVLTRATSSRICEAVADALAGAGLPTLWAATAPRPLREAFESLDPASADLLGAAALVGAGPVPPNLRAVANLDGVKRARRLEAVQRSIRAAVGTLLRTADPRLDQALAARPRPGPLCAAVLSLAAWPTATPRPLVRIRLEDGGAVPGHPASSVLDDTGPWAEAWHTAAELDPAALPAALAILRAQLDDGAVTSFGVPDAWLGGRRWSALWSRAHRPT